MDLKMPRVDGAETLFRLREVGCVCHVCIITAFAPEFLDQLWEASEKGLEFEMVPKPINLKNIRRIAKARLGLE